MASVPRILMCPPDYYGIEYEINPWMSRARGATPERARRQWQTLYHTLRDLGARVEPSSRFRRWVDRALATDPYR